MRGPDRVEEQVHVCEVIWTKAPKRGQKVEVGDKRILWVAGHVDIFSSLCDLFVLQMTLDESGVPHLVGIEILRSYSIKS